MIRNKKKVYRRVEERGSTEIGEKGRGEWGEVRVWRTHCRGRPT